MIVTTDKIKEFFTTLLENTFLSANTNDALIASVIISLIENNLIDDLYKNIPKDLVSILDKSSFLESIDYFKNKLIEVGIPENIVEKLSYTDYIKLLKVFSIFIKDVSSVKFIKDLVNIFGDNISIAELYIDYNKEEDDLYFIPKWIVVSGSNSSLPYKISYEKIYDKARTFLVPKSALLNEIKNSNIVLPIKTNLLYIDESISYSFDIVNNILIQYFLKYYGNTPVEFTVGNSKFSVYIKDVASLFEYINLLYYSKKYNIPTDTLVLQTSNRALFNNLYSPETVNNTLSELFKFLDLYNNAQSKKDIEEIKSKIKKLINLDEKHIEPAKYTFQDLQSYLYGKYSNLIYTINSYLSNYTNLDELSEKYVSLINSLLQGVNLTAYTNPTPEYIYLLTVFKQSVFYLPHSESILSQSKSVLFIKHFLPIFSELIINKVIDTTLKITGKLFALYIDDKINFVFEKVLKDLINIEDKYILKLLLNYKDNISIDDSFDLSSITLFKDKIDIKDKLLFLFSYVFVTFVNIYEKVKLYIDVEKLDKVNIFDIIGFEFLKYFESALFIEDKTSYNQISRAFSFYTINTIKNFLINQKYISTINIFDIFFIIIQTFTKYLINDYISSLISTTQKSALLLDDKTKSIKKYPYQEYLNIFDIFFLNINKKGGL